MRIALSIVCAAMLAGCATRQPLYQWGGYDEMLYQSYKSPDTVETLRTTLEVHISKLEQASTKVPPGLYAELGSLYLQSGDRTKAVEYYGKERQTWPESRGLMDALIKNLGKRESAQVKS